MKKLWNNILKKVFEDLGLKISGLEDNEEYYTVEFCKEMIDKCGRLHEEGILPNFIAIDIIYNDLMGEESDIYLNGKLLQ